MRPDGSKGIMDIMINDLIDKGIICEICWNEICSCPERPKTQEPVEINCPDCKGHGMFQFDDGDRTFEEQCDRCVGSGRINEDRLTPEELKEQELCKHWDTTHKQCTADDISQKLNPLTECNGLLMNCKNPKYMIKKEDEAIIRILEHNNSDKICKHWSTAVKLCVAEEMKFIEQTESCNGLLMFCTNPKYMIKEENETMKTEQKENPGLPALVGRAIDLVNEITENADPPRPFDFIPKTFENIDEAMAMKGKLDAWEQAKTNAFETRRQLEAERKQVIGEIIDILPFRNSWVKIHLIDGRTYGVGFYHCDHGEPYNKLDITPWTTEPMPPLNDRQSS